MDHVEAKELGLGEVSGLYIPYLEPSSEEFEGFGRLRMDEESDGQKYTQKEGTGSRLYFPAIIRMHEPGEFRRMLRGNGKATNVFIVEGEKKAFSLQQRLGARGLVLGLGGCWNWTKKRVDFDQGSRELIDDFKHVELRDRTVYICFDSDVTSNPNVAKAERELTHALRSAGVGKVRLITLFPHKKKGKVGLDDFLVECGADWEEEFRKLCWKSQLKDRVIVPRILSYEEMLNNRFKPIKVILGHKEFPLLNSGGLCYVHSMSGVGKTYFTMQMAHSLATGSKFLGEYPTAGPMTVVFLQAELSDGWFQKRIRRLNDYYGPADNLLIMNGQMTLGKAGQYGKFDINLSPLEQIIVTQRADVVFIDPLQGYTDIPENNTDANREFQRQLSLLRQPRT
jgi:hypothetical protein